MPTLNLPPKLHLYFDGLCEARNPGGWSCYGWVLLDEAATNVASGHGVSKKPGPTSTNNFAEYAALGFALRYLADEKWKGNKLRIWGDSQLVIRQITREWDCNKEHLQKLRQRCWDLLDALGCRWSAEWVPRTRNEAADALSRLAYKEATGQDCPVREKQKT